MDLSGASASDPKERDWRNKEKDQWQALTCHLPDIHLLSFQRLCLSTRLQPLQTAGRHCWGWLWRCCLPFWGLVTEVRVRTLDLSSWSALATSWGPCSSLLIGLHHSVVQSCRQHSPPRTQSLLWLDSTHPHFLWFLDSWTHAEILLVGLLPGKSLSAAKDLRRFSAPHVFPVPPPPRHTYLSKSRASEAKSDPELTRNPAQTLSALFPLFSRAVRVSVLPLLGCGCKGEIDSPLPQPVRICFVESFAEFCWIILLNCFQQSHSKLLLNNITGIHVKELLFRLFNVYTAPSV